MKTSTLFVLGGVAAAIGGIAWAASSSMKDDEEGGDYLPPLDEPGPDEPVPPDDPFLDETAFNNIVSPGVWPGLKQG